MHHHGERCTICNDYAEGEEDGFDMPPPDDKLCRMCRKAVKDAREQAAYLRERS